MFEPQLGPAWSILNDIHLYGYQYLLDYSTNPIPMESLKVTQTDGLIETETGDVSKLKVGPFELSLRQGHNQD